jgi:addiction module HigA family antidote
VATKKEFVPVTPGEMLKVEFLAKYGLSQNQLAKAIGISPNRIAEIVNNRRRITTRIHLLCMGLFFKKFLISFRHSGADLFPHLGIRGARQLRELAGQGAQFARRPSSSSTRTAAASGSGSAGKKSNSKN